MNENYEPLKGRALLIGINDYKVNNGVPPLKTAVNDAERLAEILRLRHNFDVVVNKNQSKAEFIQLLDDHINIIENDERVLVYFAGHGIPSQDDEKLGGYLAFTDADNKDHKTLLPMQDLYKQLMQFKCRHLLLILDCCFAGSFKWASKSRDIFMPPKVIYKERFHAYENQPAWQVITSSSADQKAFDVFEPFGERMINENDKYSPFAEGLFYGLEGNGDINGDGIITIYELYETIRNKVDPLTTGANTSLRQTPMLFNIDEKHDTGLYFFLTENFRHQSLHSKKNRNPYKGLESYQEEDSVLFYGRKRVIEKLEQLMEEESFIVVTGASGTGKSSLVKAGLIPEIKKSYQYNIVRPGKTPLKTLNESINYFRKNSEKLLIIDQFEKLITQSDEPKVEPYINRIVEILKKNEVNKIIVTIRLDFEPQFDKYELNRWWQKGRFIVPPLSQDEIREIILQPAIQEIITFNPTSLVDKIINDVLNATNVLPLLSYMLYQLYEKSINEKHRTNELHEDDYIELNGVIGALQSTADNVFESLSKPEQETMKKVMLRMVTFKGGELTKRATNKSELTYPSEEENERREKILNILTGEKVRLIVANKETYEPLHDALITSWAKLFQWRNEENLKYKNIDDVLAWRDRLNTAVNDYKGAIKSVSLQERKKLSKLEKGRLWHDEYQLSVFELEILDRDDNWLNIYEKEFIEKSIALKKLVKQRKGIRNSIIAFLLLLALIVSIWFGVQAKNEEINATNSLIKMQTAEANRMLQIANSYINYNERKYGIEMLDKALDSFPKIDAIEKRKLKQLLDSIIQVELENKEVKDSVDYINYLNNLKVKEYK